MMISGCVAEQLAVSARREPSSLACGYRTGAEPWNDKSHLDQGRRRTAQRDCRHRSADGTAELRLSAHHCLEEIRQLRGRGSGKGGEGAFPRQVCGALEVSTQLFQKVDCVSGKRFPDGNHTHVGASFSWSTNPSYAEDGTVFTNALATMNSGAGFAGANGWRLPTLAEIQTPTLDFRCSGAGLGAICRCPSEPCVDPALGLAPSLDTWSGTNVLPDASLVWAVQVSDGEPVRAVKIGSDAIRAVRGGI